MATKTPRIHAPSSRRERIAIATITAAFGLLLAVWACVTPLFQAPDEVQHFDASAQIAIGHGWAAPGDLYMLNATQQAVVTTPSTAYGQRPTFGSLLENHPGHFTTGNQMTQHPPTYYVLGAAVLHLVNFENVSWDVGVMALRILDVLLVAPIPLFVWMSVRRLTRSPKTALVAPMALFAVPELFQIGSSITNDAPLMLLGAVIAWLGITILTGDLRWKTVVWLGVALGVASATKGTALPLIPSVVVLLLVAGRDVLTLGQRVLRLVAAGALTAALSAWWWGHNLIAYHTLQPNGLSAIRPDSPFPAGQTPNFGAFFNLAWVDLSSSFWGQFGKLRYPMSPIVTDVLTVVTLFAIVGFGFRFRKQMSASVSLLIFVLVPVLSLLWTSWNTYVHTQGIYGLQGRYLFPSIVAGIALSALAWRVMLPEPASRRRFGRIAIVSAAAVAVYGLSWAYRAFYEGTNLVITKNGLSHLFFITPVGRIPLAILIVLLVVSSVWALVQVWRFAGASDVAGTGQSAGLTPESEPAALPA